MALERIGFVIVEPGTPEPPPEVNGPPCHNPRCGGKPMGAWEHDLWLCDACGCTERMLPEDVARMVERNERWQAWAREAKANGCRAGAGEGATRRSVGMAKEAPAYVLGYWARHHGFGRDDWNDPVFADRMCGPDEQRDFREGWDEHDLEELEARRAALHNSIASVAYVITA